MDREEFNRRISITRISQLNRDVAALVICQGMTVKGAMNKLLKRAPTYYERKVAERAIRQIRHGGSPDGYQRKVIDLPAEMLAKDAFLELDVVDWDDLEERAHAHKRANKEETDNGKA